MADCCGEEHEVSAACVNGAWKTFDYEPAACVYCQGVVDGGACDPSPSCEALTCYRESCCSSQWVARGADATWEVEDNCQQ